MMRPLRMMVAFMAGERTRPACWFWRHAETIFLSWLHSQAVAPQEKCAKAGRFRRHAGRVRSPESCVPEFSCRDASAEIKNRHAHRETVGDLIEDYALQPVRDLAIDLDPAVDRSGMHDQAVGLQKFRALFRQAKQADVFAKSRKILSALPFVLDP